MTKLNQQVIREHNLRNVFSLILQGKTVSRTALAHRTTLSKTTISTLVDELISRGFVVDDGAVHTGRQGRKPSQLRVNSEDNVVAVLNWRADHLEASLVDLATNVVSHQLIALEGQDFPREIFQVYDQVLRVLAGQRQILGVCLIVPSMLDPLDRKMVSTTLPIPPDCDVISEIIHQFAQVPLAIFNDTACYAYAENTLTQAPAQDFLFININRGIGAIIVSQGVMLQGEGGMRAQFGHYSLRPDGAPCICGNRGCLENEIGEAALLERAKRMGLYHDLEQEEPLTFAQLGVLADCGHPAARTLVDALAQDLAFALGNLFTIYHTNRVIIGGRGQRLGYYYLSQLTTRLKAVGFRPFVSQVDIQYTSLGDDAILRGAARYFVDKFYDFNEMPQGFVALE